MLLRATDAPPREPSHRSCATTAPIPTPPLPSPPPPPRAPPRQQVNPSVRTATAPTLPPASRTGTSHARRTWDGTIGRSMSAVTWIARPSVVRGRGRMASRGMITSLSIDGSTIVRKSRRGGVLRGMVSMVSKGGGGGVVRKGRVGKNGCQKGR